MAQIAEGCDCPDCTRLREQHKRLRHGPANERAEELLAPYLTPEQAADWKENHMINVRGSGGALFRLRPTSDGYTPGVIREDGMATNVWPVGAIPDADWMLAMLLYLEHSSSLVVNSGCHTMVHFTLNPTLQPSDYGGKLPKPKRRRRKLLPNMSV